MRHTHSHTRVCAVVLSVGPCLCLCSGTGTAWFRSAAVTCITARTGTASLVIRFSPH